MGERRRLVGGAKTMSASSGRGRPADFIVENKSVLIVGAPIMSRNSAEEPPELSWGEGKTKAPQLLR